MQTMAGLFLGTTEDLSALREGTILRLFSKRQPDCSFTHHDEDGQVKLNETPYVVIPERNPWLRSGPHSS